MHSKSVLVSLRYVANVLSCSVTNSFLQQHVSPFFKAFFLLSSKLSATWSLGLWLQEVGTL